jgi:hypothetical protein
MVEEEGRFLGETPAVAAQPARFDLQAISPQLMAQGPEGRKAFGDLLAAQKTLMGDTFTLAEGAKQFQRDPITGEIREVAAGAPKREPVPSIIQAYRLAQEQGFKGSLLDYETQLRQAGAPSVKVNVPVDMTGGQKGFENEMSLASKFKGEPIYKDFSEMKTAFQQVNTALSQGTPIGDVAGATKIMKLLDPTSVVRETELGMAMAAGGRLDRLQYYMNNWATGQKLTPTQREDFKSLANELFAAAGQAYNAKRDEYYQFGQSYGFKNLNTVLGPAANIPSLVRKTPSGGGGIFGGGGGAGGNRPSLNSIFGVQ